MLKNKIKIKTAFIASKILNAICRVKNLVSIFFKFLLEYFVIFYKNFFMTKYDFVHGRFILQFFYIFNLRIILIEYFYPRKVK